jgi:endoglucanase
LSTISAAQYCVLYTDTLEILYGDSKRIAPNATFKLFRKGTNTPAVIYSAENFVVANSTGTVTTNNRGTYSIYLDPTYAPYEVEYKGHRYDTLPLWSSPKEIGHDLDAFAASLGIDAGSSDDPVARQSYVDDAIGDITPGLNQTQVDTRIDAKLADFEVSGGVSESAVNGLIDAALDAYNPDLDVPDVSNLAVIRGDVADRDIVVSQTLPAGTVDANWLLSNVYVGTNGKILLRQAVAGQTPETPAPPVTSEPLGWLGEAHNHFVAAYLNGGQVKVGTTVTITDVARSLEQSALATDKVSFDKILTWAQANFRRSAQSNPKDLYGTTYDTVSEGVTNWTVNTGAMLDVFGALFRAWNLWGGAEYRDIASKIFSDLVNYCSISDEGRLYLAIDNGQKVAGSGLGHHQHPTNGGYVSAHSLGSINPVHFKSAKTFFGSVVCDQLLAGHYDMVGKCTTAYGLLPDYCSYNTATHGVGIIANGTDGWSIDLSHDFGLIAQRGAVNIVQDKAAFNETRGTTAITALKTHYAAKWTANSAIYTQYTTAGAAVGSTQTTEVALAAIIVLTSGDGSNATAAAIRAAKIPTTQGNDSNGYFVPNQVKGVTPASSLTGNQLGFIAYAKDNGKWVDITKLGSNPNVGVLYPPGSDNTGSGTTVPPVIVVPPVGTGGGATSPVGTEKLFVDTNPSRFLALGWANSLPTGTTEQNKKKARAQWFSAINQGVWIGDWDENAAGTKIYIDDAQAAGAVATVLSYRIPGRDLGQYSAGGAANRAAYETYINNLCVAIGTRKVILCLEPDSLPHMPGMTQDQRDGRASILDWAIRTIRSKCPKTWVYVDAGHSHWLDVGTTADLLRSIHIENAHGIATNVSNFRPDAEIIPWSQAVLSNLNISHLRFVYDTGRNGNSVPPQDSDFPVSDTDRFANPRGRQLGRLPQFGNTGIDKCDGWLWWKKPGESDGNNGDGAPAAGNFFSTFLYADGVADRANGSTHATSAGLLQRVPTPGVTNG